MSQDAVLACQQIIASSGSTPERLYNLAFALQGADDLAGATQIYLRVIVLQPNNGLAFNNLGQIYLRQGLMAESVAAMQTAVRLLPDRLDCRFGLAMVHRAANQFVEAYQTLFDLCAIAAPNLEYLLAAGNTALDIEDAVNAERHYRDALAIAPDNASLMNNLGVALARQDRFIEGRDQFQRTIQRDPKFANAYFGLACCQERLLDPIEADRNHQRALELDSRLFYIHSNRLMNMVYRSDLSAQSVFSAHRDWGKTMITPAISRQRPARTPLHPIRLGFVSADFAFHSVSMALPGLLDHIDRKRFTLTAYAEVARPDAMTQYYQRTFDQWRNIVNVPAQAVASQIMSDEIDVLIDLAGHTAKNRLDIFALKPARVQMTWLGYPGSTGLAAIDYRITDSIADVVGIAEKLHTERLLRLDPCFLCLVPTDMPPVKLRERQNAVINFGCFNNILKLNANVIALWSQILKKVSGSRLVLKDKGFSDSAFRKHVLTMLSRQGMEEHRIELRERTADHAKHLNNYDDIDIGLDPFPYNGAITTFEALIMGVPVITILGDRHAARVGASLLSAIGATELIALDEESYVNNAVSLAKDLPRLDQYRAALRDQVQRSMLCDAKSFARRFGDVVEHAFDLKH